MKSTSRPLLILASQSPRRKKILSFLSIPFRVIKPQGVDETAFPKEKATQLVRRLALLKASAGSKIVPHFPVIAADTLVVYKNEILGKPRNQDEALRMMMLLQGKAHEVWTGAALIWKKRKIQLSHIEKTKVVFKRLRVQDIESYLRTPEPYDKAGAYDIQGTAFNWIERWEGDYFNVMGLPIQWTVQQIRMLNSLNKS